MQEREEKNSQQDILGYLSVCIGHVNIFGSQIQGNCFYSSSSSSY